MDEELDWEQYNPFDVDYGWVFNDPFPWDMIPDLGSNDTGTIGGTLPNIIADAEKAVGEIDPYNVVTDTPVYTQQQIDDVMAAVNNGQVTAGDLVLLYPEAGLTAEQIQANIDSINNTPPYNVVTDDTDENVVTDDETDSTTESVGGVTISGLPDFSDDPYIVPGPGPIFDENGNYNDGTVTLGGGSTEHTVPLPPVWPTISGGSGEDTVPLPPITPLPPLPAPDPTPEPTPEPSTPPIIPVPDTSTPEQPTPDTTGGVVVGGTGTIPGATNTPNPQPTPDPTPDPVVPPVIPIPEPNPEPTPDPGDPEVPITDIFNPSTPVGGAASAVASAIGGAVNVNNQFDFLENSAEDQMRANRQAALDSSTLMNPNFINPYGSQTTTPAYVDANGNLVQPSVRQDLNAPQQQLFDTETSIKQGLGNTALQGIGGVQDQFSNPYDPSGLIDRYQVDPNNLSQYSDIDLNQLSARQTQPGVTGRNAITDALIAREQPRFDRAEEKMRNDLAIRGFNAGTEGYTEQTDEFGRAQNDFNLAAQQAGAQEQSRLFALESALRQQQLQEQDTQRVGNAQNREQQVGEQMDFGRYTSDERARMLQEDLALRNLPLNELNALRQGNQATVPQFQPFNATGVNPAPAYDAAQALAETSGNYADGFFGLGGELLDWFGNRTAKPAPVSTSAPAWSRT